MVFQPHTYSVILVSSSRRMNETLLSLLPGSTYYPVLVFGSVSEAQRCMAGDDFDLVIVNTPLPDQMGVDFAVDVCAGSDAGVLLLVRSEIFEETYAKVLPSGVITLSKPTNAGLVAQFLRALCAVRERLRCARQRQATVEEKIEEMRVVNRAKWLLIECLKMTEPEAHQHILHQAMEQRLSRREIAENIIRTYQ